MAAGDGLPYPIYGAAYRLEFPILDADGDPVPNAAGLDSEISKDGGNFADCINEAVEIEVDSGMYYLDVAYAENQASLVAITVKTTTAGAKTTPIVYSPVRLPALVSGTAQAGAVGSITLAATASAVDDCYNGCYVLLTANTGVGQARQISDYNGSTKVATIAPNWTAPDATSTYDVLLTDVAVNRILDTDSIGAAQLAADTLGASELAAAAATEIADAVQTTLAGENMKIQHEAVQRDEGEALRRTLYFYATGTLPANAAISKDGAAFANSANAPGTVSGNFRKLELAAAEIDTLGKLVIDVTTTATSFTAFIIVDVVDFDPFAEGAVSDERLKQLRGARPPA